jgi:hypothetical protein
MQAVHVSPFFYVLPTPTSRSSCLQATVPSASQEVDPIRRTTLIGIASAVSFPFLPTTAASAKLSPDAAYENLRSAREELVIAGRTYFPKRDMDGLRDYLDTQAVNMNNYEVNAQTLLESKRLDAESKKDIGTIRRYGVGADVMIMYGGLKAELGGGDSDTVNYREVEMYYVRTLDSLEEVISICRNNGFP